MKQAIIAIILVLVLLFLSGYGESRTLAATPIFNFPGHAGIELTGETYNTTLVPSATTSTDPGTASKLVIVLIAILIVAGGAYFLLLKT
jgi:hypothetical protein